MTANELIDLLRLEAHPEEGGYFRETYRSLSRVGPGEPFGASRSLSTAIYYLLTSDSYSALHRLPGDELFHFYMGDPVQMLMLHPDGRHENVLLGQDLPTMRPQHVVPGGAWQGSRLVDGGDWALLGTTMAPGFDFADYERGSDDLRREYPDIASQIDALLPR